MSSIPNNVSPIDVTTIVSTLMLNEQRPLDRIKSHEKNEEVQLNEYANLTSLLQTFDTNLQTLGSSFNSIGFQVTSSNPQEIVAQVTSNNVAPIPHSINVTQIAQAESQISSAFSSGTASLGISDTINVSIGTNNFGVSVATTDSLQNIRDNINNAAAVAQIGVTASIVSTSNGYQLIVSSNQTGVVNAVNVSDSNNSFGFTEETQALDAQFTFDNQNVTRATNTVTDVIDGLTINLLNTTSASVTLNVNPIDPTAQENNITTAMQAVIDSYNQIMAYVDQVQANPRTGNGTFPLIKLSVQQAFTNTITGSGVFNSLSDIGIVSKPSTQETTTITIEDQNGKSIDKEIKYSTGGQLQFNTDPLLPSFSQALQTNFSAVQSLLTNSQQGLLNTTEKLIDPLTGSVTISMNVNVNIINQYIQNDKQLISDQEERLAQVEAGLTQKYARLNVLLEKLQATNDFLSKQLDNLNNEERMR
jgi:flagellar hook-associated protein 2